MTLAEVGRTARLSAALLTALWLTACSSYQGSEPRRVASAPFFEFLGVLEIAPADGDPYPLGGLSALSADPVDGSFWMLSDDRSRYGPARAYRIEVSLKSFEHPTLTPTKVVVLHDADDLPYAPGTVDPEGLAIGRHETREVYVSSEGEPELGIPPSVWACDASFRQIRSFEIPPHYAPSSDHTSGVRRNLAFESLALSFDGTHLFTATENALYQDGEVSTFERGAVARILEFDLPSGSQLAEFFYPVEPVHAQPVPDDGLAVNGLVELLAVAPHRFWALERSYVAGVGNLVQLFEIDIDPRFNVLGHSIFDSELPVLDKRLLGELGALGVPADNYEGMALGPHLADGRRLLILVSDDNFNPDEQRNYLVALAFESGISP